MKIAVLDDDIGQTDLLCQVLTSSGHICHPVQSGREMVEQLQRESYDMLIIDWQIPDASGPEVLTWARQNMPAEVPVLFITSRSGEDDIVAAKSLGADDYMIKPLRRGEMVARVQALLRRAYPIQSAKEQIAFNEFVFETRSSKLTIAGNQIDITQKEFDLALLFFRNLGRPLSRAYILEAVWARDIDIPSRTMDTHVSRVRTKLHLRPENGYRLAPVYSYGYRLEQLAG